MKTRRSFIKTIGAGAALSALYLSPMAAVSRILSDKNVEEPLCIGIIGAESSHSRKLGRMFNIDKKFPGCSVDYVWGETDEFAKKTAEKGAIPNIVKDPKEMMEKINALVVAHRHPKYHLAAALPFVKEGIPVFIDKPFCYRVDEGKEFFKIAQDLRTPVTSFSSIAQSAGCLDMREQVESMSNIEHIVCSGPADFDSKYGGIFFYGVHMVQPLLNIFGEDVEKVKVSRSGKYASAAVLFESGFHATLIFTASKQRNITVVTKKSIDKLESRIDEPDPPKHYQDMVDMFRTGKEPRSHQSILKCVAVLQALEKSGQTGEWEQV